jgi:ATP-dependent helicase/nuclease subunit A
MRAVAPEETVWLSASAGTGKTQVLASRVLRLLLQPGGDPASILCLTFTKAGATEMAARINERLAEWVRLPETELFHHLSAIGAPTDPATRDRARTLFAAVLDCPGGGLRIDTIHAFAQWLLGAFPEEAGLAPGTRAMEDRDRALLLRQVLADLLVRAESDPLGDPALLDAVSDLSLRMGAEGVERYLLRCAAAREAWFGPGSWQEPMRPRINQLLGLAADADRDALATLCADEGFDVASLRRCMKVNHEWGTKTGFGAVDAISEWLLGTPTQRVEGLAALRGVFLTQKGEPKAATSQTKLDPEYPNHCARVVACIEKAAELAALLDLADRLVPALRLGRAFALAWEDAKAREGLIDFDDQIRIAAGLLTNSAYAQWIGYKLDRRFDHILVDEAQDTNAAQWRIILDGLTQEFFSGEGQHGDLMRTLFVVGDYKQAIFGFQGTSPRNFEAAQKRVHAEMNERADNIISTRSSLPVRRLQPLELKRSFRTAQPVLDFVDSAIALVGHEAFGLDTPPARHVGEKRPGYVALWRPVGRAPDEPDEGEEPDESSGETWLSRPDRQMADRIARQVSDWIKHGFPLVKGGARRAGPGDVMVLVRKRRDLAGLIVARLHAAGVPVAGVDRLRLGAPLAVRDLVAALRFAAQPLDDLNLACLLTSPLVGWSQEQLLAHGWREKQVRLWEHLRGSREPEVAEAFAQLGALLRLADYQAPQALLHWLLVGPWQGRRKLVARLGREANDPIDELLNAAGAYAAGATPSLVGFLNWFDAGEGELKREASGTDGLVRVMTVHGSKGLQAPIVILADAAGNPNDRRGVTLDMPDPADPARCIPLPSLARAERAGRIAEIQAEAERAEAEEHWRLLYVAMTRAEEALFIGGPLGLRETEAAEASWFAKLRQLFGMGDWVEDPIWGERLEWGERAQLPPAAVQSPELPWREPLPRWLERAPPAEPRPPKPLAPSSLGEDLSSDPPIPPGGGMAAARRGVLIHRLLERLPEVAADARAEAAARWLARNASEMVAEARAELVQSALAVLADPRWADLFTPAALAEVPIAATVGGRVIVGTIDRLLIDTARIRIVDFKTARRPPEGAGHVPAGIVRQMAAYTLALEAAFPGRAVEAALLYTATPRLIVLPEAQLGPYKRALAAAE